jgi:uncharacterized protein (TIGR00299 family) protein
LSDLYLDPFSGVAGDMFVGALLDLGASFERLREGLRRLPLEGWSVAAHAVDRGPLRATHFVVTLEGEHEPEHRHEHEHGDHDHTHHHDHPHEHHPTHDHPHRTLGDVRAILEAGDLPERVFLRALAAFELLARAEAKVHGKGVDEVHFHEVGAVDAICDIVGVCLALEDLHVDRVFVGTLPLGEGRVHTEHGPLPVPAPATLECLAGLDVRFGGGTGELVTPTGACLVASLAGTSGLPGDFVVRRVGYGAGTRQRQDVPNVLRAVLGETSAAPASDPMEELATNVDHLPPTLLAHTAERVLAAGADDVTVTPCTMKKGRSGHVLTALVRRSRRAAVERVMFEETGTLGVRRHVEQRTILEREIVAVETPYGSIRVKCGRFGDAETSAVPEFDDCRSAAAEHGVPLQRVTAAAAAALAAMRGALPGGSP